MQLVEYSFQESVPPNRRRFVPSRGVLARLLPLASFRLNGPAGAMLPSRANEARNLQT